MALIKCPECGRKNVSDKAEMCPDCGFPVRKYCEQQKSNEESATEPQSINTEVKPAEIVEGHEEIEKSVQAPVENANKMQKERFVRLNMKTIAGGGIASISIIVALMIVPPALRYAKANALFSQEDYEQAQIIYENLGDYKEAPVKVEECKFKIIQNKIKADVDLEESLAYLNTVEPTDEVVTIKKECIMKLISIHYDAKNYRDTLKYLYQVEETDQFQDIKTDCLFNMADREYSSGNYLQVIRYLDEIGDFTSLESDSEYANELLQQSLIQYGMDLYEAGEFSAALTYLTRIDVKDDTINEVVAIARFMEKIQGIWYYDGLRSGVEYQGWTKTERTYADNGALSNTADYELTHIYQHLYVVGNTLYLEHTDPKWEYVVKMYWRGDDLILAWPGDKWTNYEDIDYIYKKIESFPEPAVEPYIGMSAQEVLESTWGAPDHINKSTYSWGVNEQWCYSGYRYIYLEDGVVTSISE